MMINRISSGNPIRGISLLLYVAVLAQIGLLSFYTIMKSCQWNNNETVYIKCSGNFHNNFIDNLICSVNIKLRISPEAGLMAGEYKREFKAFSNRIPRITYW